MSRKPFINNILLFFIFSVLIISCDHGLSPLPKEKVEQGISGTIYYKGTFPQGLTEHRLIASKVYRQFRSMNEIMNLFLLSDTIQIYPSIVKPPLSLTNVDSIPYSFVISPSTYKYIAVAQTTGALFDSTKWKIVGVYGINSTDFEPDSAVVPYGEFIEDVNIYVDYDNPPPQPFLSKK